MKIYIETLQKQTVAQNSQLLTWSLFTEERQKTAFSKSASCQFSILATRNAITKATEFPTFCFSLCILVFFPF